METLPPPTHRAALSPIATSGATSVTTSGVASSTTEFDERTALTLEHAGELATRITGTVNSVVAGKPDVVEVAVTTLLAGGHLLIEDIPGVGKTLLAHVIARSVGGSFQRIQGTADLLPSDVTGSLMPSDSIGTSGPTMTFRPGPVFANIVVFDEMNRTTPRTQSALLEVAEEATVTVDGTTHPLPSPHMIVATQNPLDIAGTYRLGEGSLDRFAAVVSPGRASRESEMEVLAGRQGRAMLDSVRPVATLDEIRAIRRVVNEVFVADALTEYVVTLLEATRRHHAVRLGASTRGGVSLLSLAKARAVMHGRSYVIPDDIALLAVSSLGHRVALNDGGSSTAAGRELVADCLASVAPPTA